MAPKMKKVFLAYQLCQVSSFSKPKKPEHLITFRWWWRWEGCRRQNFWLVTQKWIQN